MRDIRQQKTKLRNECREIRLNMSEEKKRELDRKILERLVELYQYKNAGVIMTYVSKDIEVDTLNLIKRALADGKRVAVPKCIDGTYEMDFYFIKSLDDLEKRTFGVLEPKAGICRKMKSYKDCFCIVPGMLFDVWGYRIGYGRGYYDRFLANFTGSTAGICYSSCIRWRIPHGKYDKSVDILLTDKYFRKINNNEDT